MKVVFYDKYYDVPTRGIISFEGNRFPFLAEVDQESEDRRWAKGIPVKVCLFPVVPTLETDFALISKKFKKWKLEDSTNGHPSLVDAQYQAASRRIDECFNGFTTYSQRLIGLFSNDGESGHFEFGSDV